MSTAARPPAASPRFTTRPGGRWSSAATSTSWGSCAAWDGAESLSAGSTTSFFSGSHYAATRLAYAVADTAEWIPRPPREVERVG